MCFFRLRLLFIQSDETRTPDGQWIIMSFIFKSTASSSQWPNQFKYFPNLRSAYTPTAGTCTRTFSHSCILTNMLRILACPHPDDHIFLWPDLQVFVQAAETIYVLQALPICSTTSLWAAPIMGPVCDRDGWEPRGAHKTCSKEGTLEGGREGKEWTAGASSSLSRLGRTLEDSVRRANCCPLHHQSSTNPEWTFTLPPRRT